MPQTQATDYVHRYYIFVEADRLNTANNAAAQWDPDTGGHETFGSVKLSPTGEEPVTHYGAATYATDSMRNGITTSLGNRSWSSLYTDPPWTWQTALEDMGLQRIVSAL